jgi:O-antigen/teichoic acid export membrane protein
MKKIQFLINSLSLIGNRLIQGIATFTLTTVIARNLGADLLGQYILAIGYYSVFVNFFGLGLRTLFIRELARGGQKTSVYLVSGSLLQFILSIIAYISLVLVVYIMPYSAETSRICYILGLSVIPFALSNITEAIFQAQERMHLITLSTSPIYLLRVGVMILVVLNVSHPMEYVAAIMAISELAILILQWLLLMRTVEPVWEIDRPFIADSFHAAKTLFAIDGVGVFAGKIDILLISLLGSEVLIGIYGGIRQLFQPFEIICNSLSSAIFPRLSSSVIRGKTAQRASTEKFLDLLFCLSLPLIPSIFLYYGYEILIFMYKRPEFALGETPLKILAITAILYPAQRLSSYILVANKMEKYNLAEVIITITFGGLVGIFAISKYQLIGAAWMGTSMSFCSLVVSTYFIRTHLFKVRWTKVLRRPMLITSLMALLLFVLQPFHFNLLWNLIINVSFYSIILVLMSIHQLGGLAVLRQNLSGRS